MTGRLYVGIGVTIYKFILQQLLLVDAQHKTEVASGAGC